MTTTIHTEALIALKLVNDLPTEADRDHALLLLRELLDQALKQKEKREQPSN